MRLFNRVLGTLLLIFVLLAWSGGRGPAMDFAGGAGRVTGDVASALLGFFEGLAENQPIVQGTSTTNTSSVSSSSAGGITSPEIDATTGEPVGTEPTQAQPTPPEGS